MKKPSLLITLALAGAAWSVPVVTDNTATALAQTIAGPGITITQATYNGAPAANGIYTGSTVEAQGDARLSNGIVLSSGDAGHLANAANSSSGITRVNFRGSDPELETLVPGHPLFDAATLEMDFIASGTGMTTVSFWYVFGSDEYNEYANTEYNDVFGFFLDGGNIAHLPGTSTPVSINTVNGGSPVGVNAQNAGLFVNNESPFGGLATEMDGLTTPMFVQFDVMGGSAHRLKLGIADAGDADLDSWVLIGAGSFANQPALDPVPPAVPEPGSLALMGMGLALAPVLRRAIRRGKAG